MRPRRAPRRLRRAPVFLTFGLLAALLVGLVLVRPGQAVLGTLHPGLTRLWTAEGQFVCTGWFPQLQTGLDERLVYVVSAGHCALASQVKREASDASAYLIDWRLVANGRQDIHPRVDFAVGTVPRPWDLPLHQRLWLADRMPRSGRVYIAGFPRGVAETTAGRILGEAEAPSAPSVVVQVDSPERVWMGSSGSPVLDERGFVVGVVWGVRVEPGPTPFEQVSTGLVLVTPIEIIRAALLILDVKP